MDVSWAGTDAQLNIKITPTTSTPSREGPQWANAQANRIKNDSPGIKGLLIQGSIGLVVVLYI